MPRQRPRRLQTVNISNKAVNKHLAHGDGTPGGDVPNMVGYVFSDDCQPEFVPPVTTSVLEFERQCFDLETGSVVDRDHSSRECPGDDWDFYFAYNSNGEPNAVVFLNESPVAKIAYSDEEFADVTAADIAGLTFYETPLDVPFNRVTVIHTTAGSYFKLVPVSEIENFVTFRWAELT